MDAEGVYYTPRVHVRLLSLGELVGQGWDIRLKDSGIELRVREGDVFVIVRRVNNVCPMEFKVMTLKFSGVDRQPASARNRFTRSSWDA